LLEPAGPLAGKSVCVTAGPTREPIDAVRFISNRSSGRMGVAIASAAWRRGAVVTLIAGPLEVPVPAGIATMSVESTADMRDAVARALPSSDVLVMAAAPSDFGASAPSDHKIKKHDAPDSIALKRTDDILKATRALRTPKSVIVGFALETGNALAEGQRKLTEKGLDLVVVNDAREAGAGFAVETNRVTFMHATGVVEELPLQSKHAVADEILDRVEALLRGRAG
jgi:phosphopantothenoylcysteine decarboxylase/phosphopantothenate--cysteine ligase